MMEKNKKAVIQQQRNSYKTYSKAYDAIYNMVLLDEKINYYTVADKAGVSRSYLYQHEALSDMIQTFSTLQKTDSPPSALNEEYDKARKRLEDAKERLHKAKEEYNKL